MTPPHLFNSLSSDVSCLDWALGPLKSHVFLLVSFHIVAALCLQGHKNTFKRGWRSIQSFNGRCLEPSTTTQFLMLFDLLKTTEPTRSRDPPSPNLRCPENVGTRSLSKVISASSSTVAILVVECHTVKFLHLKLGCGGSLHLEDFLLHLVDRCRIVPGVKSRCEIW